MGLLAKYPVAVGALEMPLGGRKGRGAAAGRCEGRCEGREAGWEGLRGGLGAGDAGRAGFLAGATEQLEFYLFFLFSVSLLIIRETAELAPRVPSEVSGTGQKLAARGGSANGVS